MGERARGGCPSRVQYKIRKSGPRSRGSEHARRHLPQIRQGSGWGECHHGTQRQVLRRAPDQRSACCGRCVHLYVCALKSPLDLRMRITAGGYLSVCYLKITKFSTEWMRALMQIVCFSPSMEILSWIRFEFRIWLVDGFSALFSRTLLYSEAPVNPSRSAPKP